MSASGPARAPEPAPRSAPAATTPLVLAIALLATGSGCAAPATVPPPTGVAPFGKNALLIYLPGIGGGGSRDVSQ